MTRVILNGTIKGLRGKMGNLIFRQLPNGTTVVSQAPAKKTRRQKKRAKLKRSEKQKAHNSRFQDAVYYARAAQIQPLYVELAALRPMNTAYSLALGDYLKPPVIHRIERGEGCIRVEASDNILVTKVQITMLGQDGGVLEKGEALRSEGNWWEFTSHIEGITVIAEAWDLPGNVTKSTL
ncbi:MAG TPA: hypothetical protein VFG81_02960 [Anaerolineales bacterium]|jgi:hypothetical protein|nr:hypothetical protein [Anaerolineales bacterium]